MTDLEIQEQAEKMYPEYPTEPKGETRYNKDINCFKKRKAFIQGAKWMQEQDKWIELKNEPNEVPEMDCYFYNKTVGVVFIPKDEYVKIGLYTHYCPVTLPSPPKTK